MVASSPVYPSAQPTGVKRRVPLPDKCWYTTLDRLPVYRVNPLIAAQTATKGPQIVLLNIQFTEHLSQLVQGVVAANEYQRTRCKPLFDRHGAGQDDAIDAHRIKKRQLTALGRTTGVESGCTQMTTQFSQGSVGGKPHGSLHNDGFAGTNSFWSNCALAS
jgi:hypothetical protein